MSPIESLEIETLVVKCGKSIQLFRLCQAIVMLLWSISPGFFPENSGPQEHILGI